MATSEVEASRVSFYYSQEETEAAHRLHDLIGEPFHKIKENTSIPLQTRTKQEAVVKEAISLILKIRRQELPADAFETYLDEHLDNKEYDFLSQLYPGVDAKGWTILRAILDPVMYDMRIKSVVIDGSIYKRSAKK